MSRSGRASGPRAKRREVQARVAAAAAEHAAPEPVEVPPDVEAQFRAQRLYGLCKAEVVRHHPPLWPGEAVGMGIAEQWLQNLTRRIQEQAVAQMRARAEEAGIALPS